MKKLLLLILLSPFSFAEDIEIEFNLSCKVTGQVLIQSVDGVATEYSGFTDELVEGDIFSIPIEFNRTGSEYRLNFRQDKISMIEYLKSADSKSSYSGNSLYFGDTYLSENSLRFDGIFSRTTMRRYFKNDWHLMNSNNASVGDTERTLTANCMNMPDEWDEVLSIIKEIDKEKWKGFGDES